MNVVFHIDEEKRWPLVQGNVTHMLAYCEQLHQDSHIEIVVNGRAVRQQKLEEQELLNGVSTVASGVVELAVKQQEGYSYIKP